MYGIFFFQLLCFGENILNLFLAGLWIRIRIRFTSWIWISIHKADPDPGGKIFHKKTEEGKEIANKCNFIQFLK